MKFVRKTRGRASNKTVNHEDGIAFKADNEATLLNLTSTCMVGEPKFYGETGDVEKEIFDLCKKVDPLFILQLAAYSRNELYLRSVPMYLLAIAANRVDSKPFVRGYCPKIIDRADELCESLQAYINIYGKPIPNSMKKGVADCFRKFDEYQLAKYDRQGSLTLKDAMCIAHPSKPIRLLKKIHDGTLATPMTWETEVSKNGNKPKVWEKLLDAEKLPYMAMLRNLRNMLTTGDGKGINNKHLDAVISRISNEDAVRNSKQFPFRFYSAYRELSKEVTHPRTSEVLDALDEACFISYENIPHMKGTTLLACDVSGSMNSPLSKNSSIQNIEVGVILGLAMHKFTDKSIFGCFGDRWKTYSIPKRTRGILAGVQKTIHDAQEVGWSTNGYKIIEWLNDEKIRVDRMMIFTDQELYGGDINHEYKKYKENVNPKVRAYLFNLQGYGTMTLDPRDKSVCCINGWSDKVLQFIELAEKDPNAQVNYIKEKY